MNNRRKITRIKKRIKNAPDRLFPSRKKIRGKNNRRNALIKVHSVTDTDFVISTSFATYRIPRSYCPFFQNANQQNIQNVEYYKAQTSRFECGYVFEFYWWDLELLFDAQDFKKFEIAKNEITNKN